MSFCLFLNYHFPNSHSREEAASPPQKCLNVGVSGLKYLHQYAFAHCLLWGIGLLLFTV